MSREEGRTYSTEAKGRVPSVLVVDDDPLMVALITGLLASRNYSVIKSYNGTEALNVVRSQHIDLIICDVMMSTMSGYDFMEQVRREKDGGEIPFVFLTGVNGTESVRSSIEKGIEHHLPKPVEPQALLALVREKIGKTAMEEMLTKRDFDAYRRRVVHTLSHEFRTPLTAINVGTELLMEHKGSLNADKAMSLLDAVRRGGQRLEKLVKDFLLLQQIEAGITAEIFDTQATVVSVSDLIERFLSFKCRGYEEEGVSFRVTDGAARTKVRLVETQIFDCLDRLVSNAIKFTQGAKVIEITTGEQNDELRIEVHDRGCGFDFTQIESACDVFGQIDRAQNEQQGGGLGLPIARHYALGHKGRLEFTSREGGGTTVALVLPVVRPGRDAGEASPTHEQ
jgi:two-component system sensor histidine kinase/response regulator